MGLAWTLAAVLVFARLLRRSDELERRLHLEGAFYGLAFGLVGSVVYALFETRLPELRGQWVAVALLLSWWARHLVDGPPLPVARVKNRLRVLRAERDWSQADLAERLSGLPPDRERDRERALRPEPAPRLRDRPGLHLRIEDVFTPDAEPPPPADEPPE